MKSLSRGKESLKLSTTSFKENKTEAQKLNLPKVTDVKM